MDNEPLLHLVEHADDLYAKGQFGEALSAYKAVLAESPDHAWALNRVGALLAQEGDTAGAEAALTRALELEPRLAQAHSNLGNIFYARGEYEEALLKYKEASAIDPNNPIFHQNMHAALKKLGRISEAVASLKQSHRLTRSQAKAEAQQAYRGMKNRVGCLGSATLLILFIGLLAAMLH